MPALKDRRYCAVCTNHRRLTGKVLHGGHFPMKVFGFSLASCSSVSLQESRLRCVCDRRTSKRSGSLVHFLGFYVELLQEIGEAAHGEDAGQNATDPRSKDIAVNETGGDPGAETEWTSEQFADSAA